MSSLHKLQESFARALTGSDSTALATLVVSRGISPIERAGIYRNNTRETFLGAMHAGFPAFERLVSNDVFRSLVEDYRRQHPSRSGNLQHVGTEFGLFVASRFQGTQFEYLADVAAIEWAYQEVLVAAAPPAFELADLGSVSPEDYGLLRLKLNPAARLLASRFPLARIWRANRTETLDASPIDLTAGADSLLLLRRELDVEIHRLSAAEFTFLRTLSAGDTLGDALEAAIGVAPSEDVSTLLSRHAQLGAIVGFCLAPIGTAAQR